MKTKTLTLDQIRALPKSAIARKHNCSVQYVRKILQGAAAIRSRRASEILRDSLDILAVLERKSEQEDMVNSLT